MGDNGYSHDEEDEFIKILENEDSDFMEFPKEEDGTVLLSTIKTQFPDAIGIKYKGSSGAWRAIREVDNVLAPPKGGWGDIVYTVTVPDKKRKLEHGDERSSKFQRNEVNEKKEDMAVIGLPFETDDKELKEYFGKFGELLYCEVKVDRATGISKGFGFIRYSDEESANQALNGEHTIRGRKVEVRKKKQKPMQLYVGRLPDGTTKEDLRKYFSQFGPLSDVYIPIPFRKIGFITFTSGEDAQACLRENHVLNGVNLNVDLDNRKRERREKGQGNNGSSQDDRQNYQKTSISIPPQPSMFIQPDKKSDLKNMLFQILTG